MTTSAPALHRAPPRDWPLLRLLREALPPGRRGDAGAGAVALVQLVVLALVALPGSFYLDDLSWTNRAAGSDLGWSYLRGPEGHHLIPGSMLWFWLQAHVMPLNHTGAVLLTLVLQAVVTV